LSGLYLIFIICERDETFCGWIVKEAGSFVAVYKPRSQGNDRWDVAMLVVMSIFKDILFLLQFFSNV
jgi:hypothetical protein